MYFVDKQKAKRHKSAIGVLNGHNGHNSSYNEEDYYYICNILISSSDFNTAGDSANKIKKYLDSVLGDNYIILGPSVSSIVKLKNKYRFNIMIKYKNTDNLYKALNELNNINIKDVNIDISLNI